MILLVRYLIAVISASSLYYVRDALAKLEMCCVGCETRGRRIRSGDNREGTCSLSFPDTPLMIYRCPLI
jgi:hypothetical protein